MAKYWAGCTFQGARVEMKSLKTSTCRWPRKKPRWVPKRSLAFDHQGPNHAIDSPCGPVHATARPLIASRKRPRRGVGGAALAISGNTLGASLLIQTALDPRIACANC